MLVTFKLCISPLTTLQNISGVIMNLLSVDLNISEMLLVDNGNDWMKSIG
jgi:hypothetical protein